MAGPADDKNKNNNLSDKIKSESKLDTKPLIATEEMNEKTMNIDKDSGWLSI